MRLTNFKNGDSDGGQNFFLDIVSGYRCGVKFKSERVPLLKLTLYLLGKYYTGLC